MPPPVAPAPSMRKMRPLPVLDITLIAARLPRMLPSTLVFTTSCDRARQYRVLERSMGEVGCNPVIAVEGENEVKTQKPLLSAHCFHRKLELSQHVLLLHVRSIRALWRST